MKTQFATREEVLQDTINYFWGRPERRCFFNFACQYTPTETSEGCAIGRLLDIDVATKLSEDNITINGMSDDIYESFIPEWLRNMGKEFLIELQYCHDAEYFVNKDRRYVELCFAKHIDFTKITFPEI